MLVRRRTTGRLLLNTNQGPGVHAHQANTTAYRLSLYTIHHMTLLMPTFFVFNLFRSIYRKGIYTFLVPMIPNGPLSEGKDIRSEEPFVKFRTQKQLAGKKLL